MLAQKKNSRNSYLMRMKEERRDTECKESQKIQREEHHKNLEGLHQKNQPPQ